MHMHVYITHTHTQVFLAVWKGKARDLELVQH